LRFIIISILIVSVKLTAEILPNAPIHHFMMPGFGSNGYLSWIVEGEKLEYISKHEVFIENFELKMFSGDEHKEINTRMLSPSAKFLIKEKTVKSNDSILIHGSNFEISGRNWEWSGKEDTKIVEIKQNPTVTFYEELDIFLQ
tara:strand:- start:94 stop:522 length:429 start_codon:yes stop_codon:yes gene_type:complete